MPKNLPDMSQIQLRVKYSEFMLKSLFWSENFPKVAQYLFNIISNLQCITILLWGQLAFLLNYNDNPILQAVCTILKTLNGKGILTYDPDGTRIKTIVGICVCYFAIFLAFFINLTLRYFLRKSVTRTEKILVTIIGQSHLSVFMWMIGVGLLDYLRIVTIDKTFPPFDDQIGVNLAVYILICLNFGLGFIFSIFSYDPFISSNAFSTRSCLFQVLTYLLKCLLCFNVTLFTNPTFTAWAFVVVPLVITGIRHYHLLWSFPYYQRSATLILVIFSTLSVLISIMSLPINIMKSVNSFSGTILVYGQAFLAPLCLKFTISTLNHLIMHYLTLDNNKVLTKRDVFKKLFALVYALKQAPLSTNSNVTKCKEDLLFQGILKKEISEKRLEEVIHQRVKMESKADICDKNSLIKEICEYHERSTQKILMDSLVNGLDILKQDKQLRVLLAGMGLESDPSGSTSVLYLEDLTHFTGITRLAALNLREKLEKEIIRYFKQSKEILDLRSFIEQEYASVTFIKQIHSNTKKSAKFWLSFCESKAGVKELFYQSQRIEEEFEKIESSWKTFTSQNRALASSLGPTYSFYLSMVRNAPYLASKVVNVLHSHSHGLFNLDIDDRPLSADTLNNPNILVFYASMAKEKPGKVTYASSNLTELLGWTQQDVLQQNINVIMPFLMREKHNMILSNHLRNFTDRTLGSRMYKTFDSFVLNKAGYIVPCEVYISVYPQVLNVPTYVSLVRIKNVTNDYILISKEGRIEGFTREIAKVYSINSDKKLTIKDICKNHPRLDKAMKSAYFSYFRRFVKKEEGKIEVRPQTSENYDDFQEDLEPASFLLDVGDMPRASKTSLDSRQKYSAQVLLQPLMDSYYYVVNLQPWTNLENDTQRDTQRDTHANTPSVLDENVRFNFAEALPAEASSQNLPFSLISGRTQNRHLSLNESPIKFHAQESQTNELLSPASQDYNTTFPEVTRLDSEQRKFTLTNTKLTTSNYPANARRTNTILLQRKATFSPSNSHMELRKNSSDKTQKNGRFLLTSHPRDNESEGALGLVSPTASHSPLVELIMSPGAAQTPKTTLSNNIFSKKKDNYIKRKSDLLAVSADPSSYKAYMIKLEQAISLLPKNRQLNILNIIIVLFILILIAPLAAFQFENDDKLRLVQTSVQAISKSVFRLVRITDLGQYSRNLWQAKLGLYTDDRYTYLGWHQNVTEQLTTQIHNIVEDLNEQNNDLRAFVDIMDEDLQDRLYENKVPVFEMGVNGEMAITREVNVFDLITDLVATGIKLVESGTELNKDNPYLFFCLNNTFNDLLVSSQQTIPILLEDSKQKLEAQTKFAITSLICMMFASILVLAFFYSINRKFVIERDQFLNIFLRLDKHRVRQYLATIDRFASLLERNSFNNKKIALKVNDQALNMPSPSKSHHDAKTKTLESYRGLNTTLVVIYSITTLLVLILFSAYPALVIAVNIENNLIVTKMGLKVQSNLNLYNTNFLLTTIYEYIQENMSSKVRNRPIKEEWENTFIEMSKVQDFLLLQLLDNKNGLGGTPQLYAMAMGSLCDNIPTSDPNIAKLCKTMGGGVVEKGIVGFNSYTLSSVKSVKDYFDHSNRTTENMKAALSMEDLINIEVFYPFTYKAYKWIDNLIESKLDDDFKNFRHIMISLAVVYLFVYIVAATILWPVIRRRFWKEICDWRKIMRQIPLTIIKDNKMLKRYLARTSNGVLTYMD